MHFFSNYLTVGRYGDPLNSDGDLDAMASARALLLGSPIAQSKRDIGNFEPRVAFEERPIPPPGSVPVLYLSVPIGQDCTVYNMHRVYGMTRLKLLLRGWKLIGFYDNNFSDKPPTSADAFQRLATMVREAGKQLGSCKDHPAHSANF